MVQTYADSETCTNYAIELLQKMVQHSGEMEGTGDILLLAALNSEPTLLHMVAFATILLLDQDVEQPPIQALSQSKTANSPWIETLADNLRGMFLGIICYAQSYHEKANAVLQSAARQFDVNMVLRDDEAKREHGNTPDLVPDVLEAVSDMINGYSLKFRNDMANDLLSLFYSFCDCITNWREIQGSRTLAVSNQLSQSSIGCDAVDVIHNIVTVLTSLGENSKKISKTVTDRLEILMSTFSSSNVWLSAPISGLFQSVNANSILVSNLSAILEKHIARLNEVSGENRLLFLNCLQTFSEAETLEVKASSGAVTNTDACHTLMEVCLAASAAANMLMLLGNRKRSDRFFCNARRCIWTECVPKSTVLCPLISHLNFATPVTDLSRQLLEELIAYVAQAATTGTRLFNCCLYEKPFMDGTVPLILCSPAHVLNIASAFYISEEESAAKLYTAVNYIVEQVLDGRWLQLLSVLNRGEASKLRFELIISTFASCCLCIFRCQESLPEEQDELLDKSVRILNLYAGLLIMKCDRDDASRPWETPTDEFTSPLCGQSEGYLLEVHSALPPSIMPDKSRSASEKQTDVYIFPGDIRSSLSTHLNQRSRLHTFHLTLQEMLVYATLYYDAVRMQKFRIAGVEKLFCGDTQVVHVSPTQLKGSYERLQCVRSAVCLPKLKSCNYPGDDTAIPSVWALGVCLRDFHCSIEALPPTVGEWKEAFKVLMHLISVTCHLKCVLPTTMASTTRGKTKEEKSPFSRLWRGPRYRYDIKEYRLYRENLSTGTRIPKANKREQETLCHYLHIKPSKTEQKWIDGIKTAVPDIARYLDSIMSISDELFDSTEFLREATLDCVIGLLDNLPDEDINEVLGPQLNQFLVSLIYGAEKQEFHQTFTIERGLNPLFPTEICRISAFVAHCLEIEHYMSISPKRVRKYLHLIKTSVDIGASFIIQDMHAKPYSKEASLCIGLRREELDDEAVTTTSIADRYVGVITSVYAISTDPISSNLHCCEIAIRTILQSVFDIELRFGMLGSEIADTLLSIILDTDSLPWSAECVQDVARVLTRGALGATLPVSTYCRLRDKGYYYKYKSQVYKLHSATLPVRPPNRDDIRIYEGELSPLEWIKDVAKPVSFSKAEPRIVLPSGQLPLRQVRNHLEKYDDVEWWKEDRLMHQKHVVTFVNEAFDSLRLLFQKNRILSLSQRLCVNPHKNCASVSVRDTAQDLLLKSPKVFIVGDDSSLSHGYFTESRPEHQPILDDHVDVELHQDTMERDHEEDDNEEDDGKVQYEEDKKLDAMGVSAHVQRSAFHLTECILSVLLSMLSAEDRPAVLQLPNWEGIACFIETLEHWTMSVRKVKEKTTRSFITRASSLVGQIADILSRTENVPETAAQRIVASELSSQHNMRSADTASSVKPQATAASEGNNYTSKPSKNKRNRKRPNKRSRGTVNPVVEEWAQELSSKGQAADDFADLEPFIVP